MKQSEIDQFITFQTITNHILNGSIVEQENAANVIVNISYTTQLKYIYFLYLTNESVKLIEALLNAISKLIILKYNANLSSLALRICIKIGHSKDISTKKKARELIKFFFENSKLAKRHQFQILEECWKHLNSNEKIYPTSLIGIYKFNIAYNLLISNFSKLKNNNNSFHLDLIIMTIKSLQNLNSPRIVLFINTIIKKYNYLFKTSEIRLALINLIASNSRKLFFNLLKTFLKHTDNQTRQHAVRALFKINLKKATRMALSIYNTEESPIVLMELIEQLGRSNTKTSTQTLLTILNNTNNSLRNHNINQTTLEHKIIWSLKDINYNVSSELLFKYYKTTNSKNKLHVLEIISESTHQKSYVFLYQQLTNLFYNSLKNFKHSKDSESLEGLESLKEKKIKKEIISQLGKFDNPKSIELLLEIYQSKKQTYAYDAFKSLLDHTDFQAEKYIAESIGSISHHSKINKLFLKALGNKNTKKKKIILTPEFENFIIFYLKFQNDFFNSIALSSSLNQITSKIFKDLIISINHYSKTNKRETMRLVNLTLYSKPNYIILEDTLLLDKNIYMELDHSSITEESLICILFKICDNDYSCYLEFFETFKVIIVNKLFSILMLSQNFKVIKKIIILLNSLNFSPEEDHIKILQYILSMTMDKDIKKDLFILIAKGTSELTLELLLDYSYNSYTDLDAKESLKYFIQQRIA